MHQVLLHKFPITFITSSLSSSQHTNTLELGDRGSDVERVATSCASLRALVAAALEEEEDDDKDDCTRESKKKGTLNLIRPLPSSSVIWYDPEV